MTEDKLQENISKYMSTWFNVTREVKSNDGKCRIDIIMIHKSDIYKKYPIGIEVKLVEKKQGKDLAKWLKQAHKYTQTKFIGFGEVLVITVPQITGYYLNEGTLMNQHDPFKHGNFAGQNNVNTFLGGFNIGELQKYNYIAHGTQWDKNKSGEYLRIVYKASLIWDGVNDDLRTHNIERLWLAE